ncbi:Nuclear transport factor 2 [Podila humilis]|nr:Nuclear transport factor 2 [Podila humilis]
MAATYEQIGAQFVEFYYKTFDTKRTDLAPLYRENSMLSFEGSQTLGAAAIVNKLASLPFGKVVHQASTTDFQPIGNDILVNVTGALKIDDGEHPQLFAQTFLIKQESASSFYIQNDIFRLIVQY